ncbi:MAG: hypothetical protein AAGG09_17900 [Pseudomonadota bacterium]
MIPRVFALTALLALAACAEQEPAASQNANFFLISQSNGSIRGTYNPAGFSTEDVRGAVEPICDDVGLASFSEAPRGDGLTAFTGQCNAGETFGAGRAEVRRRSADRIEVTYRSGTFLGQSFRRWSV